MLRKHHLEDRSPSTPTRSSSAGYLYKAHCPNSKTFPADVIYLRHIYLTLFLRAAHPTPQRKNPDESISDSISCTGIDIPRSRVKYAHPARNDRDASLEVSKFRPGWVPAEFIAEFDEVGSSGIAPL